MFILKAAHEFEWPVIVQEPEDGKHQARQFFARFLVLPQDEIEGLIKDSPERVDVALLRRALIGWRGVQDATKEEVPFSDEAREQLIAIPYVRLATVLAYRDAIAGIRRKN